jgi:hypothetical protein
MSEPPTRVVNRLPPGLSEPQESVGIPDADPSAVMRSVEAMQGVVSELTLQGADAATVRQRLKSAFRSFKTRQPLLFEKASKLMSPADMAILKLMLSRMQDMKNETVTRHDASVSVGQVE